MPVSECQYEHHPVAPSSGAVVHLGDARRVGVVEHLHGRTGGLAEHRIGIDIHPALVDVGGRVNHPAPHDPGETDAERLGPVVVLDDLADDAAHRLGGRRVWCRDAEAVRRQFTGLEVDDRPLHSGATDVDPEPQLRHGCDRSSWSKRLRRVTPPGSSPAGPPTRSCPSPRWVRAAGPARVRRRCCVARRTCRRRGSMRG